MKAKTTWSCIELSKIKTGIVQFHKAEIGGEPAVVGEASEGAYFGELALIQEQHRQVTVIAKSRCIVLELDRKVFEKSMGPMNDVFKRNSQKYEKYIQSDSSSPQN